MNSLGRTQGLPPIAVVSMAGIFPGAGHINDFFTHILNKQQAVIPVPEHRWPALSGIMVEKRTGPDRAVSNRAGFITDFQFDPAGFLLPEDLLTALDPVHHLVLQAGRAAFEGCCSNPDILKRTGVVLAAISLPTDSSSLISMEILTQRAPCPPAGRDALRASVVSGPGAVLCRALGLWGGCFTLDAACASSLFAVKLACEQLRLGKTDMMLAGGVSRPDSLYTQVGFSQLMALSPSGRCAPFDRHADGLVVGEGCGILVLKRLEDALDCGDQILGIIRGTGVSNDIEGNLVAPATEGQIRAMIAAYDSCRLRPDQIQYMECHGTGTPVGDKIETHSIKTLMDHYQCPDAPLAIGSVKSMIGHLLTAAGAASLIKTLMALNQKVLPPSANFEAFPEDSPLSPTRITVQTTPEEWRTDKAGQPRRAAVSAFGFGGINAHVLVEEFKKDPVLYPVPQSFQADQTEPCAIVGMHAVTGLCSNLQEFMGLVLGKSVPQWSEPGVRWPRQDLMDSGTSPIKSAFINEFTMGLGEFHIPPNQLNDILPQHLILLKAVKGALEDAGISPRPEGHALRTRMGCAMGIDFDFNAANFFMRWKLAGKNAAVTDDILENLSPPLTFDRTLGALGGIAASRTAREFQLGGPCFTLSAGAASGISAIDTALYSLRCNETHTFIAGCVDMAGDIRQYLLNQACDPSGNGPVSEGAAAIVLKRLDQAIADKDRIYAVITGTGSGSGGRVPGEKFRHGPPEATGLTASLEQLFPGSFRPDIDFIETHSNGTGRIGQAESVALENFWKNRLTRPVPLRSALPVIGDTRSVSGLLSVISAAVCLYKRQLPGHRFAGNSFFQHLPRDKFDLSADPIRLSPSGKRPLKALASAVSLDGIFGHVLLEQGPPCPTPPVLNEKKPPFKSIRINTTRPPLPPAVRDIINQAFYAQPGPSPRVSFPGLTQTRGPLHDTGPVLAEIMVKGTAATAKAHEKFLEFSQTATALMQDQFAALTRHAAQVMRATEHPPLADDAPVPDQPLPLLDKDMCMEFAVGKAGRVLGPQFDIIDTYPARVRLPDAPLMLVDRIMDIQGEICSLGPGKIVTQHDVTENAWYLDGGKTPVSISIEAGQADLFLCSYLGIDHAVKGKRKYRLLDARVTFHRQLPQPGDTIEYHIEIDRFLKQGDIYLFFFHYKGYINSELLISMRDGCAGFFTDEEVTNSGGIILRRGDREPVKAKSGPENRFLVPVEKVSLSSKNVDHLRQGNLEAAFGPLFKGVTLGVNQRLPGGRMHLIDRVLDLDPAGGRYGLGSITAQADIHPDDWFLTCHFIDDMVMPGTLMYECCAHALRIFVQRAGWVSPLPHVRFDVLPQNESNLKCRGPVTPETSTARYEIHIKKIGFTPKPYVIADAHMFSDDLRIVWYQDMGMTLEGITKNDLETFWRKTLGRNA